MHFRFGLLALLFASSAFAQYGEAGFYVGAARFKNATLGTISTGATTGATSAQLSLKDGWKFGMRLTINDKEHTGHEVGYGYNRTTLRYGTTGQDQGMAVHQGSYAYLLYATDRETRIRPFVAGGVQFSNFVPPGASVTQGGGDTKYGLNYGAGIKVRINPLWQMRVDVRNYWQGKPFSLPGASGKVSILEASAGFSVCF
jgi:hypothetical protein